MVLLNIAIVAFTSLVSADFKRSAGVPEIILTKETAEVSKMDNYKNPVILDAVSHNLVPNTSIVTLVNPAFEGNLPPGSTQFMLTEVLGKKGKTVYPLVGKSLTDIFPGYTKDPNNKDAILVNGSCRTRNGKVVLGNECDSGYTQFDKEMFEREITKTKTKRKIIREVSEETVTESNTSGSPSTSKKTTSNLVEEKSITN